MTPNLGYLQNLASQGQHLINSLEMNRYTQKNYLTLALEANKQQMASIPQYNIGALVSARMAPFTSPGVAYDTSVGAPDFTDDSTIAGDGWDILAHI